MQIIFDDPKFAKQKGKKVIKNNFIHRVAVLSFFFLRKHFQLSIIVKMLMVKKWPKFKLFSLINLIITKFTAIGMKRYNI